MSKSDRERASRLRRRVRDGASLSERDSRWLARYDDDRRVSRVEARAEVREATPAATPQATQAIDMVEIPAAPATPAATPQATSAGVVQPGAALPAPQSLPGAPPHGPACAIKNCPGCAGLLRRGPETCATTGALVYPDLSQAAARGFAALVLALLGVGVRMYARLVLGRRLDAVEPNELERSELAEALVAVFRARPTIGALGQSWGDMAAVLGVGQSLVRRQLAAPVAAPVASAVAT